MSEFSLNSYSAFKKMRTPNFGPEIDIDFNSIHYYKRISDKSFNRWDKVRSDVKDTFDDIGLINAEKEYLGVGAFYYCNNLTSVTIPNSVTSIGNYAFLGTPQVTVDSIAF